MELEAVDLRVQVGQRNRAICCADHLRCRQCPHHLGIPTNAASFGGIGFGRDRYGNVLDAGTAVPWPPSEMRGPLPLLMRIVKSESTMSWFTHRPPHVRWGWPRSIARSISR